MNPAKDEIPLLVYGGSSAVGAFAIKLAKLANIHPIITVAGSGSDLAKSVGADEVVDYRKNSVVEDVKKALNGKKLIYAYDAISEDDSLKNVFSLLDQGGKMTTVLPNPQELSLNRAVQLQLSRRG
ncbi:MAG: hypothetical protein EON55_13745 [Alphaproteobacteria bacterium]|nr:MAG: hypothetical protein EON55_13745 [Alphaproteobacteria bacterium]